MGPMTPCRLWARSARRQTRGKNGVLTVAKTDKGAVAGQAHRTQDIGTVRNSVWAGG